MSVSRPQIVTVGLADGDAFILRGDGEALCIVSRHQALWLIARLGVALAGSQSEFSSTAAARSGCAGDGEGARPSSPDLAA